jgi:hypothetical protein
MKALFQQFRQDRELREWPVKLVKWSAAQLDLTRERFSLTPRVSHDLYLESRFSMLHAHHSGQAAREHALAFSRSACNAGQLNPAGI